MPAEPPPTTVLRAFGVDPPARRLAGGQGRSWLAGDVVLKPAGGPVQEWLARALVDVRPEGVRIAPAVTTRDGRWLCRGWSATRWVEGREPDRADQTTSVQIIEAGRAFHRAVAEVVRPDCLDARTDAWALADRAAWGERPLGLRPELADLARRLQGTLEPPSRSQLVHGDLTTNVLFAPGGDPAVIDVSPYWRPPEYAEGVVLADALVWYGASASLLELAGVPVAAVARALLFRIATTNERATSGGVDLHDEARRFATAVAAIGL